MQNEELQRFDIQSLFSFAKRSSFAHLMEVETALMFFHKLDRFSEDIALDVKESLPKVEKIRDFYDLAFLINQHPNFFSDEQLFQIKTTMEYKDLNILEKYLKNL